MKARALGPAEITPDTVAGRVLCHDVVGAGPAGRVRLPKGRLLRAEDAPVLAGQGAEVHLLELAPGDVHEDQAATRLADLVAGPGVAVRPPVESQALLRAERRGLVRVESDLLLALNSLPDVSVFTAFDYSPVDIDEAIGAAKVTPLAIAGAVLDEAESLAGGEPIVQVLPFLQEPVGVVVRERLTATARDRFEAAIRMKLGWFGSPLTGIQYLPENPSAIAAAMRDSMAQGARLVLAAGVNSTDPLDLTIQALELLGARTEKRGVPAHPGSTCWLAYVDDIPIFGLGLCGMFSHTTVLDLLLPRFLTGERVLAPELATLGHGGLLGAGRGRRFPNYDAG